MQVRKILAFIVVLSMVSLGGLTLIPDAVSAEDEATTEVTIVGKDGTIVMNITELQTLTAVEGDSQYQNQYGNWRGAGTYTGVLISDLVERVGGMEPGDTIVVTSSDGYNTTYSYNNIYNEWPDESVQGDMILAYGFNGTVTPGWEDGLRIAFLPEDAAYSNDDCANTTTLDQQAGSAGSRWAKWVSTITVVEPSWTVTLGNESFSIVYGDQQIRNITSYTAAGAREKSTGEVVGPNNYTGVNVTLLLDSVGGINEDLCVVVTARDGYEMIYNYHQVVNESAVLMLAYEMDGEPMWEDTVPRLVYVGQDAPVTDGHLWTKQVASMVLAPAVPEYCLNLSGAWILEMDRSTLESGIGCHKATYDDEGDIYSGIPLWRLCGYVDDPESVGGHDYRDDLNYNVTIYSVDGFNRTLSYEEVRRNNQIILANMLNGGPLGYDPPLRLVGDLPSSSFWIKQVTSIVLNWEVNITCEADSDSVDVGESVELTASIEDEEPIADQIITFWDGDEMIGEALTDEEGRATLEYTPSSPGDKTLEARFVYGDTVNSAEVLISVQEALSDMEEEAPSDMEAIAGIVIAVVIGLLLVAYAVTGRKK